ncbi:hypothetical protein FisN_2Lh405 [Fistulifera solaris]|uniref:Uncharacterized protein n=1 Tax=Fistulifera solaris TaxID=1519565 RepID=A0A1Z5JPQ0_FISSO|nr:hypothetical protein FisN_2Lh405 [Fistulifera solaris]|eukprot:GAX15866.1 hypothetical protein FisN_2Lh405 [Fistulifera solaris]
MHHFSSFRLFVILNISHYSTFAKFVFATIVATTLTRPMSISAARLTPLTRTAVRHLTNRRFRDSSAAPSPIEQDTSLVSTGTHVKNTSLAVVLLGFCGGVAYYSMRAVGQAAAGDDPIAALRQEAMVAQERHEKEEKQAQESQDMLEKFKAGDYDPDRYEEEDDNPATRKKPWWKIW